mmetsp:Transcript_40822/g.96935  ORF Transcript_40822/g.96935 Transcript_40822/m.96935 type:complete len:328 (+) Transcript_40822:277-1260(+)
MNTWDVHQSHGPILRFAMMVSARLSRNTNSSLSMVPFPSVSKTPQTPSTTPRMCSSLSLSALSLKVLINARTISAFSRLWDRSWSKWSNQASLSWRMSGMESEAVLRNSLRMCHISPRCGCSIPSWVMPAPETFHLRKSAGSSCSSRRESTGSCALSTSSSSHSCSAWSPSRSTALNHAAPSVSTSGILSTESNLRRQIGQWGPPRDDSLSWRAQRWCRKWRHVRRPRCVNTPAGSACKGSKQMTHSAQAIACFCAPSRRRMCTRSSTRSCFSTSPRVLSPSPSSSFLIAPLLISSTSSCTIFAAEGGRCSGAEGEHGDPPAAPKVG